VKKSENSKGQAKSPETDHNSQPESDQKSGKDQAAAKSPDLNSQRQKAALVFVVRWLASAFGLWIALRLFGQIKTVTPVGTTAVFLLAGLIFSFFNTQLKPWLRVFALPFVLITFGLFTLILNGFLVWLTVLVAPDLKMGFGGAVLGGIVLSLINYVVSAWQSAAPRPNKPADGTPKTPNRKERNGSD
jgi:putative membrane protein